jgi:hypothetical protein
MTAPVAEGEDVMTATVSVVRNLVICVMRFEDERFR